MMFSRTQADGVWLGGGYVPTAADWEDLNTKIFRAVNGSRGGTWAPKSAIAFPSGGLIVNGPTLVAHGGELETSILDLDGQSTWPQLAPGHALSRRTILQSMLPWEVTPPDHWARDEATASIRTIALAYLATGKSQVTKPARGRLLLEVQDCATLASAVFTFRVPERRRAAPFEMPRFRIVRVDRNGKGVPLASVATGADADGWQSPPKVTSAEKWYANGAAQTFTYVCDQNNVVDVSLYGYYAEILEEDVEQPRIAVSAASASLAGAVVIERRADVALATTGPLSVATLENAITIDGQLTANGDRVLIKHGINDDEAGTAYMNGIWIANTSGPWSRAGDLAAVENVARAFFISVTRGDQNRGTAWTLSAPFPTAISNTSSLSGTADIYFDRFTGAGNIYHSIAANFENITELRWQ